MTKLTAIIIAIFLSVSLYGQAPVHFSYKIKKEVDRKYKIQIIADVDEGWHIYSQTQPTDAIATPTSLQFTTNPLIALEGRPEEVGQKELYKNEQLNVSQYQYSGRVAFIQTVIIKGNARVTTTCTITYQACTNERCLPPAKLPISISLP